MTTLSKGILPLNLLVLDLLATLALGSLTKWNSVIHSCILCRLLTSQGLVCILFLVSTATHTLQILLVQDRIL